MRQWSAFAVVAFVFIMLFHSSVLAQPTIYLVRHAEKLAEWPDDSLDAFHPLSVEGMARAERLVAQLEGVELAAIFCSPTTRSIHTALPVSLQRDLPVTTALACMDTSAIIGFYADLRLRFRADQAVLLVSHSNIIPYFLLKAGAADSCRENLGITGPDEDGWLLIEGYDHLWRVTLASNSVSDCSDIAKLDFP